MAANPPPRSSRQLLMGWHHLCTSAVTDMPEELSMRQWAVMTYIYLHDTRHSITSLAYVFDLPKPSICRVIDALVLKGFVSRKTDAADRRQVILSKTLKGIAFLNQFVDILDTHRTQHYHQYTDAPAVATE